MKPAPTVKRNDRCYVEPTKSDVLCGRGLSKYGHPGNHFLRKVIAPNVILYQRCTKRAEKSAIIAKVIQAIYREGGRFLKRESDKCWYDGGLGAAKHRVGVAFRDSVAKKRRTRCISRPEEIVRGDEIRCEDREEYDRNNYNKDDLVGKAAFHNAAAMRERNEAFLLEESQGIEILCENCEEHNRSDHDKPEMVVSAVAFQDAMAGKRNEAEEGTHSIDIFCDKPEQFNHNDDDKVDLDSAEGVKVHYIKVEGTDCRQYADEDFPGTTPEDKEYDRLKLEEQLLELEIRAAFREVLAKEARKSSSSKLSA